MALTNLRKAALAITRRIHRNQLYAWIMLATTALDASGASFGAFDTATDNVVPGTTVRVVDFPASELGTIQAGATIYVKSSKAGWHWDPTSVLASDGIKAVNPTSNGANPGRFVRNLTPIEDWRNQATWFVDAANGNDENDGTAQVQTVQTLTGPIASYDEFVRRTAGQQGIVRMAVAAVINQVGDFAGHCEMVVSCDVTRRLTIQGVLPAASFTGAISAHTNLNAATSTFTQATSTWNPTTELGRLVHDTTADLWAWVGKDLTGNNSRMSPWSTIDTVNGGISVTLGNAANLDAVLTFVPPQLGSLSITAQGNYIVAGNPQVPILIQNLNVTTATERTVCSTMGQRICFQNCAFAASTVRFNGGSYIFNNCKMLSTGTVLGNDAPAVFIYNAGLWGVGDGTLRTFTMNRESVLTVLSHTLFQDVQATVTGRSRLDIRDASWADTATPITLSLGGMLNITTTLWGSGNTGVAVAAHRGSDIYVSAGVTPTLTGNVGGVDFSVGASNTAQAFDTAAGAYIAAGRNCSWANLVAAVGAGGFGSSIFDPASGCRVAVDA